MPSYEIDGFDRDLHGALLDSQILAEVYLAMTSGQKELFSEIKTHQIQSNAIIRLEKNRPAINVIKATDKELKQHNEYFSQ